MLLQSDRAYPILLNGHTAKPRLTWIESNSLRTCTTFETKFSYLENGLGSSFRIFNKTLNCDVYVQVGETCERLWCMKWEYVCMYIFSKCNQRGNQLICLYPTVQSTSWPRDKINETQHSMMHFIQCWEILNNFYLVKWSWHYTVLRFQF